MNEASATTASEPEPEILPRILLDDGHGPAALIPPWRAACIVDSVLGVADALARGGDLLTRRTPDARAQS